MYIILYYILLYYITLHYFTLYYITLYYTILCYLILYYIYVVYMYILCVERERESARETLRDSKRLGQEFKNDQIVGQMTNWHRNAPHLSIVLTSIVHKICKADTQGGWINLEAFGNTLLFSMFMRRSRPLRQAHYSPRSGGLNIAAAPHGSTNKMLRTWNPCSANMSEAATPHVLQFSSPFLSCNIHIYIYIEIDPRRCTLRKVSCGRLLRRRRTKKHRTIHRSTIVTTVEWRPRDDDEFQ